jgi:hypothetical protein
MRDEFSFSQIQSVEFCVNLTAGDARTSYLVPTDQSVQDALTQVLNATLAEIEPADGDWAPYELSEKYAARESLRAALDAEEMAVIRALYAEEGWDMNSTALADPARLVYYFGVFRDDQDRKLLGVRQATQFKGAFKGRFLSVIDDTLRMVADRVFKLDNQFDFFITGSHIYVLHPTAFERIAELEAFVSAKAREMTVALGAREVLGFHRTGRLCRQAQACRKTGCGPERERRPQCHPTVDVLQGRGRDRRGTRKGRTKNGSAQGERDRLLGVA